MDINTAIEKLAQLKKMSKSLGKCELIGFDNESFTVRVKHTDCSTQCTASISSSASPTAFEHHPVLGFAEPIA